MHNPDTVETDHSFTYPYQHIGSGADGYEGPSILGSLLSIVLMLVALPIILLLLALKSVVEFSAARNARRFERIPSRPVFQHMMVREHAEEYVAAQRAGRRLFHPDHSDLLDSSVLASITKPSGHWDITKTSGAACHLNELPSSYSPAERAAYRARRYPSYELARSPR